MIRGDNVALIGKDQMKMFNEGDYFSRHILIDLNIAFEKVKWMKKSNPNLLLIKWKLRLLSQSQIELILSSVCLLIYIV